jgi:L-fuculose-phosphate aldolase
MYLKGSIIMIAENHDLRKEVLQACRGLGLYGLGSGIGGHVSARYPDEPYFYINTFDRTFEEMQIEDIILVDFKGNAVNSSRSPSIGIDFHYAIYNQRPDVRAVVHSHGFWITAQAAYCRPPRILNNVSAVFYERTAISSNDDFHSIGEAIGESNIAIVIPWHGAITVGATVGEAVSRHVVFDYTSRLDVTLPAHTPTMPHEQCAHFREVVTEADYYNETWKLIKRKADAS